MLVPPAVPKCVLAEDLPEALLCGLRRYNDEAAPEETITLRVARHAGEVHYDPFGVSGTAINHTFRLIDAPAFKDELTRSAS